MTMIRLIGGGSMWWYVIAADGKLCGAAHEDDADGMARLRAMVRG